MLYERKRFNYMANNNYSSTSVQKKQYGSAIKPTTSAFHQQNVGSTCRDQKDQSKKVQELENVNKRLVDQTARQFKKLEEDVLRVENILGEKESNLEQVKELNQSLQEELHKANDEKKILIQAIFQKDLVIKEYESKVKELIEESTTAQVEARTPQKPLSIQNDEVSTQTEPLPESCPKADYASVQKDNFELQDEVFRLRQELFDATNKVKLLTQQFEAYKILKEIESVQQN